jgi:hypothetical protein
MLASRDGPVRPGARRVVASRTASSRWSAQCLVPIGRDAWALARLASLDVLHQLERVLLYVGDEAADEGWARK